MTQNPEISGLPEMVDFKEFLRYRNASAVCVCAEKKKPTWHSTQRGNVVLFGVIWFSVKTEPYLKLDGAWSLKLAF